MDWPLSREEKKHQLLRLYNDDVKAADTMVESGNKALEALREQLDAVRHAAGIHQSPCKAPAADTIPMLEMPAQAPLPRKAEATQDEVERLRQAVESAAAVLRAILPTPDDDDSVAEPSPQRCRARSEGAIRETGAAPLRPALCRTPRGDKSGRPKRKVSFGGQPEEEPAHSPAVMKDIDVEGGQTAVILQSPPSKKVRSPGNDAPRSPPTCNADAQKRSGLKSNLTWLACGLGLASLGAYGGFQMSSNRTNDVNRPSFVMHDQACWTSGFSPQLCCSTDSGPRGLTACWDHQFTYERCCLGKKEL